MYFCMIIMCLGRDINTRIVKGLLVPLGHNMETMIGVKETE